MNREFLNGLELPKDVQDCIMAEYGKSVQGLRERVQELTEANNSLKESSKISDEDRSELEYYRTEIENAKKQSSDEMLTRNIMESFGDKKFSSDYARNGLIADIKSELSKPENIGKSISDITEYLTKDKTGIFENPNKPADMPGMGEGVTPSLTKEMFSKMSYNERIQLKANDPETFSKLNS